MNLLGLQRSRSAPATEMTPSGRAAAPPVLRRHAPIAPDARSCCCPAAPVAQVTTISLGGAGQAEARPVATDILLCAHHLRRSAESLRACGAAVYDRRGDLLDSLATVFASDR